MRRLERGTWAATVVLVVAALALVFVGSLGLAASLPLALVFGALAVAVYGAAPDLRDTRLGHVDSGDVLGVLWVGPTLAALVVVVVRDASAGELQAVGGVVGLVGMALYFLRPVVLLVAALVRRVANA